MDSILTTIKKLLGLGEEYTPFDQDIMIDINSVFSILRQLGVGPIGGYAITSKDNTWSEFLGDRKDLEGVKTYIYLKVRQMFDPPQMGYLVDSIQKQCTELEWRLNVEVDPDQVSQ